MLNTNVEQLKSSEWWDIKKAAAYLGMSVAFLRKAVRLRKVPFARVGSKSLRFRRSDLDCWLKANGCSGEPGTSKARTEQ
jgi:excisionase family DNA binding protein